MKEIKRAILFTIVTMALFGGAYHLAFWALGRIAFPSDAEGSLIRRDDGTIVGSRLIAQSFTRPEYFRPRPSGCDYNAASAGGTNYGPSNPDHLAAVKKRLEAVMNADGVPAGSVPSEMVTASGGGLDPDIPPSGADIQAARVAAARGVPVERIRALIREHTKPPSLRFFGRSRVNVLELNLALDRTFGGPRSKS